MTEVTRGQETKTERELAQEASAIAAGLPPTPPSPYEEAAKFKAEKEAEEKEEVTGKVEEALLSPGAVAGKETAKKVHPELVELVESGAPAAEIYELARRTSGSYAAGVREQLASQFRTASELTGEARIKAARALQILPEGFDKLPQELKDAYAVSDEAYNKAVEAHRRARYEAAHALDVVRTPEGYDLAKAFAMGLGKRVYAAQRAGLFTPEQVVEAQFGDIEARAIERTIEKLATTHTYIQATDEWISNEALSRIKEQSKYGYDILMEQGIDAYNKAISDALTELEPYKRPSGYRLKPAVAAGIPKTTLSLLFPKEDVEDAWKVKRVPIEEVPEVEAKPVSGLPTWFTTSLPVAAAISLAEPTPFTEPIVITGAIIAAAGLLAYAAHQGRDIEWDVLWDEVTDAFKKETGREPTKAEVAKMETAVASLIQMSPVKALDMPIIEAPPMPAIPYTIEAPPTPAIPYALEAPPTPARPFDIEAPPTPAIPYVIEPPPIPAYVEETLPQIIAAQSQVTTAEKELDDVWVIIRPKILKPGEFLPSTVPKTETALIALDEAVGEAYTAGEIDEDTLRVYSQARTNLLTKKGLLDAASKAYIGGMQPELADITQELASSAFALALSNLQKQANKAATDAYNQALTQGLTQTQAQTATQIAAQNAIRIASQTAIQNAVRTATQSITNTATISAVQTATRTAVNTATATMAQTATAIATGIPPIKKMKKVQLPEGTIAFAMGAFWKYLVPPWTQRKFLTLPKGVVPAGAVNTSLRSPYTTIQVIGKPRAEVPETISADIGIADVEIYDYGRNIRFAGRGMLTDVGERLESPTRGISIPSVGIEEYRFAEVQTKPKRRPFKRPEARKYDRSRKRRNWLHEVTRPPTISEMMR